MDTAFTCILFGLLYRTKYNLYVVLFFCDYCTMPVVCGIIDSGKIYATGSLKMCLYCFLQTSIRLLYPFFSLPTPGPNNRFSREDQRDSPDVYVPDYLTQNKLHKLLLLGHEGSGRSTIFKQVCNIIMLIISLKLNYVIVFCLVWTCVHVQLFQNGLSGILCEF